MKEKVKKIMKDKGKIEVKGKKYMYTKGEKSGCGDVLRIRIRSAQFSPEPLAGE